MQQYRDAVLSPGVRAIVGASITVTLAAGGAATLYSGNGTGVLGSNVLTSDAQGEYTFYAANGRYTLTIAASGYTTTTRDVVMWDPAEELVSVARFGVVGDGIVDDHPAFQLAVDSGEPLFIPAHFNCRFAYFGGVNCPSGFKLYGPGKITVDAVGTFKALDIGNAYVETNGDKSDIVIDGVQFYSAQDSQFSAFVYLENGGGDLTDVVVRRCKFRYAPSAITGGDRWAVTFGGELGDLRARIYVDDNVLYGPMQLTANGGSPNYEDISISRNRVVNGRNACIALSRLASGSGHNTYDRIAIKGNQLHTDRGIGIFLGADSSTASTAPMTWRDIDVDGNSIVMSAGSGITSQFGVFFRAPEGAASIVQRLGIRNNKIRVNASGVVGIGTNYSNEGTATKPTVFEYSVINNEIYGGAMDLRGGSLVRVSGNVAPDERSFFREGIVAEVSGNEMLGVVLDGSATVYSENNRVIPRATGQRCFYVNSASGKTNALTSVGDILDYRGASGSAESGYRVEGLGTATVKVINPVERYTGWSQGLIYLLNSQVLAEYRPLKPTLALASTAVGNVTTGEDDLMAYAMPAGILNQTGRGVRIKAWGTYANNTNAKTLKLYLGSAAIFTQALTVSQAGEWRINAIVISTSTGSDAQNCFVEFEQDGTAQARNMAVGTATQDEEAAITIKCTGEGSNSNDVVQNGLLVEALN